MLTTGIRHVFLICAVPSAVDFAPDCPYRFRMVLHKSYLSSKVTYVVDTTRENEIDSLWRREEAVKCTQKFSREA